MMTAFLRSAGLLVLLASAGHAADWRDQPPPGPYARPGPPVPFFVDLVPDCSESWEAELLRCAPRSAVTDPTALPIVVRRKSVLAVPRKPYPQLFSWDAP